MEVDPQNAAAKTVRDGEYFCAMWNFDGPKSEEAKSRGPQSRGDAEKQEGWN